jgi:hypothetical protein
MIHLKISPYLYHDSDPSQEHHQIAGLRSPVVVLCTEQTPNVSNIPATGWCVPFHLFGWFVCSAARYTQGTHYV